MQKIVDTMWREATNIYRAKKNALEQGDEAVAREIGEGKDLLSILCTLTGDPLSRIAGSNNLFFPDLFLITVRANTNAEEQDRLPEKELIGQISYVLPLLMNTLTMLRSGSDTPDRTFVFAAMDTTSNALAMTLSLLAEHPEVQQKLREEILEASKGQDLDYDALVSLPYLDAVCRETLRLYVRRASLEERLVY